MSIESKLTYEIVWNDFIIEGKKILNQCQEGEKIKIQITDFLFKVEVSLSQCIDDVKSKKIINLNATKLSNLKLVVNEIQGVFYKTILSKFEELQRAFPTTDVIGQFIQKIKEDDKNINIRFDLANLYLENNEHLKAIDVYTKIIKLAPKDKNGYYSRGYVFRMLKQYKNAKADYESTLKLDGGNLDAHNGLGLVCEALEEYDEALDHYNKAITQKDPLPKALLNRGLLYKNHFRKNEKAVEDLTKALNQDPTLEEGWFSLGLINRELKKYDQGINNFSKVIDINKKHPKAFLKRGELYEIKKENLKAIKDYTEALLLDKSNVSPYDSRKDLFDRLSSEERKMSLFAILDQTGDLQQSGLTDSDIDTVVDALMGRWEDNITLNLSWNLITDKGIKNLCRLVERNPYLVEIVCDSEIFDTEEGKALRKQLDHNFNWQILRKKEGTKELDHAWIHLLEEEKIAKLMNELETKLKEVHVQLKKKAENPLENPQSCSYKRQYMTLQALESILEQKYGNKIDRICRKKLSDDKFLTYAEQAVQILLNPQMDFDKKIKTFFQIYIISDVSELLKKKECGEDENFALIDTIFFTVYIRDFMVFNQLRAELDQIETKAKAENHKIKLELSSKDDKNHWKRLHDLEVCIDRTRMLKMMAERVGLHQLKWSEQEEQVLALFEKMAKNKDASACYELGKFYETTEKGLSYFIEAATLGNAEAQYKLFLLNKGKESKNDEAIVWLTKAAKQKHLQAQWDLACYYRDQKDDQNAFYWLKEASVLGLYEAQCLLADYYKKGIGTQQDDVKAFESLLAAATNVPMSTLGLCSTMKELAKYYQEGIGTKQDNKKSTFWLSYEVKVRTGNQS